MSDRRRHLAISLLVLLLVLTVLAHAGVGHGGNAVLVVLLPDLLFGLVALACFGAAATPMQPMFARPDVARFALFQLPPPIPTA